MGKGKTAVTAAPQYSYQNRKGMKSHRSRLFDMDNVFFYEALVPPAVYQMVGMTCPMGNVSGVGAGREQRVL